MNKKLEQLRDKLKHSDGKSERITNDTVAEHREKVLAGGRKFKYPVQYSKHKILINTAIIVVATMLLFAAFMWWMLYKQQARSDFFYNATKVVPVSVANVDGQAVPYADYLRRIRSSVYYLERVEKINFNNEDGKNRLKYLRRHDLDLAEQAAFANKILRQNNIKVTNAEIDEQIMSTLSHYKGKGITARDYEEYSLKQILGWTLDEYREVVRDSLAIQKASFEIDNAARDRAEQIKKELDSGADFAAVVGEKSDHESKASGGAMTVHVDDLDPNGLIKAAKGMEIGAVSGVIKGSDGYYIIKLTAKNNETIEYSMIKIALTEFRKQFDQLRKDGKIKEFIDVEQV